MFKTTALNNLPAHWHVAVVCASCSQLNVSYQYPTSASLSLPWPPTPCCQHTDESAVTFLPNPQHHGQYICNHNNLTCAQQTKNKAKSPCFNFIWNWTECQMRWNPNNHEQKKEVCQFWDSFETVTVKSPKNHHRYESEAREMQRGSFAA